MVIFAAGTGNPFFSTDTTSALRASEMGACAILKATMVDGVYNADPKKDPDAVRYESISFRKCLSDQLAVMDATAFSLCMENNIPIIVFDLNEHGNIAKAITGAPIGTVVSNDE